jgi:hypothetical protein
VALFLLGPWRHLALKKPCFLKMLQKVQFVAFLELALVKRLRKPLKKAAVSSLRMLPLLGQILIATSLVALLVPPLLALCLVA